MLQHPWIAAAKKREQSPRGVWLSSVEMAHMVQYFLHEMPQRLQRFIESEEGRAGLRLLKAGGRELVLHSFTDGKTVTTLVLSGKGLQKQIGTIFNRRKKTVPLSYKDAATAMLFCDAPCRKTHEQVGWIRDRLNEIANEILHEKEEGALKH